MKTLNISAKTLRFEISQHVCTCPNQHLLAYGETCEICMGILDVQSELAEILPQPVYDAAYFEELESYLAQDASKPLAA
ncbi:MAG: hypothetical protein H6581_12240 [Bacteroidia bacterium]|nr:hypothetical protein [Bacteroidia bacterium]